MLRYLFYFFILISSGLYAQNKDLNFYKYAASKLQKEPMAVWCYINEYDCVSCLTYIEGYVAYFNRNNIPYYIIWKSGKLDKKDQISDFENLFGKDKSNRMILETNFPSQLQYRPKNSIIVYNKISNEFEFKGVDLRLSDLENIKMLINPDNITHLVEKNSYKKSNEIENNLTLNIPDWLSNISKIGEKSFLLDTCQGFYFLSGYSGSLYRYRPNEKSKILYFNPKIFVDQSYNRLMKVFADCNPNFKINPDTLFRNKLLLDTTSHIKKFGWLMSTKYILTNDPNKIGFVAGFTFCRDLNDATKVFQQGCAIAFINLVSGIVEEYYSYPVFTDEGTPILNYTSKIIDNSKNLQVNFLKTLEDGSKVIKPAMMKISTSGLGDQAFTFFNHDSVLYNSNLVLNMHGFNWQIKDTIVLYNPQLLKFYYLTQTLNILDSLPFPFNNFNCSGFFYNNSPLLLHYIYGEEKNDIKTLWYNQGRWVEGNSFVEKDKNSGIGYYILGDKLMRIGNGKNGKIEFKTLGKLGF